MTTVSLRVCNSRLLFVSGAFKKLPREVGYEVSQELSGSIASGYQRTGAYLGGCGERFVPEEKGSQDGAVLDLLFGC